jgi:hypothetical protein
MIFPMFFLSSISVNQPQPGEPATGASGLHQPLGEFESRVAPMGKEGSNPSSSLRVTSPAASTLSRYPSEGLGQGASTTNGVIVHAADRLGHC